MILEQAGVEDRAGLDRREGFHLLLAMVDWLPHYLLAAQVFITLVVEAAVEPPEQVPVLVEERQPRPKRVGQEMALQQAPALVALAPQTQVAEQEAAVLLLAESVVLARQAAPE